RQGETRRRHQQAGLRGRRGHSRGAGKEIAATLRESPIRVAPIFLTISDFLKIGCVKIRNRF
ncbi:MAG: hypothetical protein IJU08_01450, partial [Bacteroidales bacterium]|nr:hypothetical protein [Bacteroidales bacterium]